jgi:hypothetical protein
MTKEINNHNSSIVNNDFNKEYEVESEESGEEYEIDSDKLTKYETDQLSDVLQPQINEETENVVNQRCSWNLLTVIIYLPLNKVDPWRVLYFFRRNILVNQG